MKRFSPRLAVTVLVLVFLIGLLANAEADRIADYLSPDVDVKAIPQCCFTPSKDEGKHPLAQIIAHSRGH